VRIAMVTSYFYPFPSGSANRFCEVARRLSRKHEVHVYTTHCSIQGREKYLDGVQVHRYGRIEPSQSLEKGVMMPNLRFSLDTLKRMRCDMAGRRFDIVDCNITSKFLPLTSFLACRFSRVPLIQTWHEVWYTQNFRRHNPFLAPSAIMAEYTMPKLADFCVAVSNTTRERLLRLLRVPSRKVIVIPNGVDLADFRGVSARKRRRRIVYVGRLESHKQVSLLVRAFKEVRSTLSDSELFIAGDGSQRRHLMKLTSDLDLTDVHFLGVIPRLDLIRMIKSSATLVLPSLLEGHGIVLLEAMAAGTPPIAVLSPGSAVKDIVTHESNGLLAQPTVKEMERAIFTLLTNKSLYSRLRQNGLKFVEGYDWDKVAARTLELYEHVAAG